MNTMSRKLLLTLCMVTSTTFVLAEPGAGSFYVICVPCTDNCPNGYQLLREKTILCEDRTCFINEESSSYLDSYKNSHSWLGMIYSSNDSLKPLGVGVLINDRHFLTAAHVLESHKASKLRVRLRHGGNDIKVKSLRINEGYALESGIPFNDVAVMVLKESVDATALLIADFIPNAKSGCYVPTFSNYDNIETVKLRLMRTDRCLNKYRKNYGDYFTLRSGYICAEPNDRNNQYVKILPGAPMMCQKNDHWYVSALVSYALIDKSSAERMPGIYTDVTKHEQWIKSITNQLNQYK